MKNTFGNSITLTVFGESHGKAIGAVLDGIAPGIPVDESRIAQALTKRRPYGNISTQRREKDEFSVISGVYNGYTTGTPLCIVIPNKDTDSKSYSESASLLRPGHADYTSLCKYHGFADPNGGGHFSGRITAAICAVCSIIADALAAKGIKIGTHIKRCAGINDRDFSDLNADIDYLNNKVFAALSEDAAKNMINAIEAAANDCDSVGGILETAVTGIPAGIGEPFFDSMESAISHAIFSIGGIKGVEFGTGFAVSDMRGSEANDDFRVKNGAIYTETNNNGGINGGITNGMPVIFRCAVKPTPSISRTQNTVDISSVENTVISVKGRHDPCIVHRVRAVIDALTALCVADMLCVHFGTDYLKSGVL